MGFLLGLVMFIGSYLMLGPIIMGIYTLEQAHRETEEMAMETDIMADET